MVHRDGVDELLVDHAHRLVDVALRGLLQPLAEGGVRLLVGLLPRLQLLEHPEHGRPRSTALHQQVDAEQIRLPLLSPAPRGQHQLVGGIGGELHVGHGPLVASGSGPLAGQHGLGPDAELVERLPLVLHVAQQVRAVVGQQHVGELVGEDRRDLVRALERFQQPHRHVDVAVRRGEGLEARVGEDHHPPRHAGAAGGRHQTAPRLVQVLLEGSGAHEAERVAAVLREVLLLTDRQARCLVGARLEPRQHRRAAALARQPRGTPRGRLGPVAARSPRAAGHQETDQGPAEPPAAQLQFSPTPRTAPVLGGRPATRVRHSSSLATGTTRSVSTANAFTQ